jgi:DNA-binding NarL/FixJ family response regulator
MDRYGSRTLTVKEQRITQLVSDGLRNQDIGPLVGLGEGSVKNKLRVIMDKTGMGNRLELALWQMSREGNQ